MAHAISLVTLLTDFGDKDYFVASMKGVILGINPQARIVDLTHQVPPHHIESAAYLLRASYNYFPDGTVHVAVVDPGVGSSRRALLVSTSRYHFLAPDNGLLSYIFRDEVGVEVRQIDNKQYRLDSEGATFDGRDLFAPAAAWLTRGQQPGSYGRLVLNYARLPIPEPAVDAKVLTGQIVYVDRFGNLITNIGHGDLIPKTDGARLQVHVGPLRVGTLRATYADVNPGEIVAFVGSTGMLEIAINQGDAASQLRASPGTVVVVR